MSLNVFECIKFCAQRMDGIPLVYQMRLSKHPKQRDIAATEMFQKYVLKETTNILTKRRTDGPNEMEGRL